MLKWTINLLCYSLTLAVALGSIPYFAWTHGIVTIHNLAISLVVAPVLFWGVWYSHGILFDNALTVSKYMWGVALSRLQERGFDPKSEPILLRVSSRR